MSTNKKISIKKFVENIGNISDKTCDDSKIKLYPKQEYVLSKWANNRYNITIHSRQTGGSMLGIIYALYDAIFNNNDVLIMSVKFNMSRELMTRLLKIINSSEYLSAKVSVYDISSISFINNGSITFTELSPNAIRGKCVDTVIVDNIDYSRNASDCYRSIIPIVSCYKNSKFILFGTPSSKDSTMNEIFNNPNDFSKTKILWNEVFKRDAKWKTEMMQMLGGSSDKKLAQTIWNKEYALKY